MFDPSSKPPLTGISLEQMRMILDVSRAMTVTMELDPLLRRIAEATCSLLGCERASIFLHDPRTGELWSKIALHSPGEIRVPAGNGIAGHAFSANTVIHVPDAYVDPRFLSEFDRRSGFVTRNLLAAPMVDCDDKPVGVVQALNKSPDAFDDTDVALLRLLANQAGVALQRWKLQRTAVQSSGLRHEMELARRLQEGVVPKHPPQISGLACAGWTQAASINGGDCYDLWKLPDGNLAVLMSDASGHGLPAALIISQVRALIRMLSETETDPLLILRRVNSRLRQDLECGRFVTAFLASISPQGQIRWCSAGQAPIIFHEASSSYALDASMPPLGIDPLSGGETQNAQLSPGGMLVLVSDGFSEAFDPSGDLLGAARIIQAVRAVPNATPQSIIQAVRNLAADWQRHEEPADDQTVLVVRRN